MLNFNIINLNLKIRNLESNGFREYLNTWENETVHGQENLNHIIMTCTKGYYSGWVADIYYNESDKRCFIEYSNQHKQNPTT